MKSQSPQKLTDYSLLPANKTNLERAIELAFFEELRRIILPVPDLLNGQKTPLDALPFLALDRQVNEWNSDDTEKNKRNAVSNNWLAARLAGTPAGIEKALEGLGGQLEMSPWHEYGGEPYHLKAKVWLEKPPDPDNVTRTQNKIEYAKSTRDTVALSIGTRSGMDLKRACAVQVITRMTGQPYVPKPLTVSIKNTQTTASAVQVKTILTGGPMK